MEKYDRKIKNGSGFTPEKEPDWYLYFNPVLSERNKEINVTSSALQTSFDVWHRRTIRGRQKW